MQWKSTRRRILQVGIAGVGGLWAWLRGGVDPFGELAETSAHNPASHPEELFEGFVLLDWGTPMPDYVVQPSVSLPVMEQLPGGPAATAVTSDVSSAEELARDVGFPVYALPELGPVQGYALRNKTGDVVSATLRYGAPGATPWQVTMARPAFPKPYPVWPGGTPEYGIHPVVKMTDLPEPGIARETSLGFLAQWIRGGVLYSYESGEAGPLADAKRLTSELVLVS